MMKIPLFAALVLALGPSFAAIRAVTPEKPDGERLRRHFEKMATVTNGGAKVVFVGDSIVHYWETNGKDQLAKYFSEGDLRMLNLGTAGDRTEHVLWRITEGGELDGYEAKIVVLSVGMDSAARFRSGGEPPADTILGIRKIVKTIRAKQPKALLVLNSLFPCGAGPNDERRLRNEVVNREIRKLEDGRSVVWLDVTSAFSATNGAALRCAYHADFAHPNATGYEFWYKALRPYLAAGFASPALPPGLSDAGTSERAEPPALCPVSRIETDWWADRLLEKRNQIADANGEIDLVFFGDSITHNWERHGKGTLDELRKTYSVLDIGYSGDRTEHLLWRGQNGELDGYKAKCIMLMIGTNNAWHRSDRPEDTAEGIRRILALIAKKQPQAKVLLLPIFPFGDSPTHALRVINDKVNVLIRGFANGRNVVWVDFTSKFLDAKGDNKAWMPDRCHPGDAGYREIWLPAVLPYFKEACGK